MLRLFMRRHLPAITGVLSALVVTLWTSAGSAQFTGSIMSQPLISMVALAALSLLPFAFMTGTSFVKIAVVFSILRNALGTGQVPSGPIITALALVLSIYVMAPVGRQISDAAGGDMARAAAGMQSGNINGMMDVIEKGKEPFRQFLFRNSGAKEQRLFLDLARRSAGADHRKDVTSKDLIVLFPAFLITELTEAFQIGFIVFVPFLIIDMVVSNVLLALGMHMMAPTTVSLPFKLLLFVMVDGWYVLSKALVTGYH